MTAVGNPIEAVLTLNATSFHRGIDDSVKAVERLNSSFSKFESGAKAFGILFDNLITKLNDSSISFSKFESQVKGVESFNKFANGVKALATAIQTLGTDSATASVGITKVIQIVESMGNLFGSSTIKVEGLAGAVRQLIRDENNTSSSMQKTQVVVSELSTSINTAKSTFLDYGRVRNQVIANEERQARNLATLKSEFNNLAQSINNSSNAVRQAIAVEEEYNVLKLKTDEMLERERLENERVTNSIRKQSEVMQLNGAEKLRNMGYTGKLAIEEEKLTQTEQKQSVATDRATQSMNRQTTATNRLSRAMSSLKMIGTMVASMMVWNFASNLVKATRETVNAKSEMQGYFQMLGYTTSQTDRFNKALDETVKKFPRLNKYALGETISSIGVEFELTTKEMEKAMPVVSMITSEYLRAGRNVNEASLAVKDILQGEFQRLSRETGVKADQLKEAGWSGDKTDVMGLLKALDKVGKDRNWDKFVAKANSLNDAVLILQNRFGEWSADMVNQVQPTIVGVFNALMDVGGMLGQSLSGIWQWLTGGSIEALVTQIGLISGAVITVSQALVMYRTGMGLAQTSQLGFTKSLASLVLGLKGQEIAEIGVRNAILSKIMGVKGETIAQRGLAFSIKENTTMNKLATIEEKINTASLGENSVASKLNAVQQKLNKAETEGLIIAKDKETIQEEINTIAKESNTLETIKQGVANEGLIATLYMLGTGEAIVTGETGALTIAWGVLNGVFALSPIGWVTTAILGLAGALYVLTGGLDDHWGKMQEFNDLMDNSKEVIKENKKYLKDLGETLGTDSQIYQDTAEVVNSFNDTLKSSKKLVKKYKEEVANIDIKLTTSFEENLKGDYGFTDDQIKKFREFGVLDEGKSTYQRALDVIYKQEVDAEQTQKDILDKMDERQASDEDIANKSNQIKEHEANLIRHSAEHNTSEDWWGGTWSGLLAGIDSIQLWMDYATEDLASWYSDFQKDWENIPKQLSDAWNSIDWGIDISAVTKWFDDVGKSLEDSWKSVEEMWNNNIVKPLTDWWNGFISLEWLSSDNGEESTGKGSGGIAKSIDAQSLLSNVFNIDLSSIEQWFDDNVKKPVLDAWNGFISFDWLPSIDFDIGSLFSGFFGSDEEGSDPNDIDPISTWVNNNIITPLTNFANDPIGTIGSWGLTLPQIDLGSLIQGMFPIGGEGGFDLGQWLSDLFNIDSVVSYFTTNLSGIISSVTSTASTVGSLFNGLKTTIQGHLTGIVTNVSTGFENAKNYANTKITAMRDSVKSVIDQMTGAWKSMKDSILDSARLIYDGVKKKFDDVKTTLSDFFTKLQNPSQWGSGFQPYSRQPKPQTARRLFSGASRRGKHGAGVDPYTQPSSKKMSIRDLVDMVGVDEQVNIAQFLALFSGGFGGWDFHKPSKDKIFNTGKEWKTAPPSIQGIGSVGDGYKVGRFWNGKPSFTFSEFEQVAQAVFSAIPYKFYYDSEWKGDWVSALLSGAVNCWDGANALIALARLFGFDGYPVHTTTKGGVGHFYAMIGGKAMDTTHFQNSGSWSPLGGAGIPTRTSSYNGRGSVGNSTTQNINITITGDVYGEEDFISRVREGAREVMREEFNDPLSGVV